MVPEAEFTSYYGRPIVKPSPWEIDIPAYIFAGGLAAGSSLLAARGGPHRAARAAPLRPPRRARRPRLQLRGPASHDLGRPARFLNMLRIAKLTSPMSVGTWILTAYGPFAGAAAAAEVAAMLPARWRGAPCGCSPPRAARPASSRR